MSQIFTKRDDVLNLRLCDPVLGGGDEGEAVSHHHVAVLGLHLLEQQRDAVSHAVGQVGVPARGI